MAKSELKDDLEPMKRRSCRRCGSCCRTFTVTLNEGDLRRESRLKKFAVRKDRLPKEIQAELIAKYGEVFAIRKPCPFLLFDNGICVCRIYRTRPDTCRRYYPSEITCNVAKLEEQGVDTISTVFKMIGQGHAKSDVLEWMAKVDSRKFRNKIRRLLRR